MGANKDNITLVPRLGSGNYIAAVPLLDMDVDIEGSTNRLTSRQLLYKCISIDLGDTSDCNKCSSIWRSKGTRNNILDVVVN